jgi:hypothetical protein
MAVREVKLGINTNNPVMFDVNHYAKQATEEAICKVAEQIAATSTTTQQQANMSELAFQTGRNARGKANSATFVPVLRRMSAVMAKTPGKKAYGEGSIESIGSAMNAFVDAGFAEVDYSEMVTWAYANIGGTYQDKGKAINDLLKAHPTVAPTPEELATFLANLVEKKKGLKARVHALRMNVDKFEKKALDDRTSQEAEIVTAMQGRPEIRKRWLRIKHTGELDNMIAERQRPRRRTAAPKLPIHRDYPPRQWRGGFRVSGPQIVNGR